jgi:acyl carrier protein
MKRAEIVGAVEEAAFLPSGTLQGNEALASIASWDSLTGSEFRLIVLDRWQVPVSGAALLRCETIADIVGLLGSQVED